MPLGPEHRLQVACAAFVAKVVDPIPTFTSIDRGKATSGLAHLHQSNRGVKKGVSDCFMAQCGVWGFVELKAGRNTPDDAQVAWGASVVRNGGFWFAANSVDGFRKGLAAAGIAMHPRAELLAMDFDLRLSVPKPASKRGERPVQRPERVSPSRMARANAVYVRTLPK